MEEGHTKVWPRLAVVPVGWSWALHLSQLIHEGLFESDEELEEIRGYSFSELIRNNAGDDAVACHGPPRALL